MSANDRNVRVAQYEIEVPIERPRADVWRSLTEEIDAWWLPDFHMVGEGSVVTLDARAGGQLLEARADGSSLLWCSVHMCVPGEALYLVGHLAPDWGGPTLSMLKIALEDRGEGTLVRLSDSQLGPVSDENLRSQEDGWRQLLGDGLKRHCER
jgi:uncharacterized protein YndB with AHSA1/START domain